MIRATCLSLLLLVATASAGEPITAKGCYEDGQNGVRHARFEEALKSFKMAVKLDPDNKVYAGRAMMISRVLKARKYVETAKADAKWEKVAISLHAFYVREGLLESAVKLDRRIYAGRPSAKSAALLSETLLESGKDAEALKHLQGLDKKHRDLQNRVYEGIALARLTKVDEAKKLAKGLSIPEDTRPGILYDLARLHTLTGEMEKAAATLTRCFAALPAKSQAPLRASAKQCPDFKLLAATPAFATALATASKVKESDCSGGSGCGSCPERDKCGTGKKSDG